MYFLSLTVRLVEYSFSMTTSLNHWPISTPHRVLGASWLTPWGWGKPYKWLASLKSSSVVPQLVMSCAWYLSTHSKTGSASLTAGFPHPLLEWIKPCSLLSRRQMHPPVQFSIALLMYQHSLKLTEHQNQGWRLANDCMTTACTVHTVTHTHTHTCTGDSWVEKTWRTTYSWLWAISHPLSFSSFTDWKQTAHKEEEITHPSHWNSQSWQDKERDGGTHWYEGQEFNCMVMVINVQL